MPGFLCKGLYGVVLLASAAVAQAQQHAPASAPTVHAGDSWTYQYTDVWKQAPGNQNRLVVTGVDAAGVHVDVRRAKTDALVSRQLFTAEMNPVERGKMHFSPAFGRYAFPLEPGKEWSSEASGENADAGKTWRYQIKGKAIGWETITVPAGQFEAIKIVVVSYYSGQEVGTHGGSGRSTETVWYAPEVNHFVKMNYEDTDWRGNVFNRDAWVLTAFEKKPAAASGQ